MTENPYATFLRARWDEIEAVAQEARDDFGEARVYYTCRKCATHTYQATSFVGYRLYGSEDANPKFIFNEATGNFERNPAHTTGPDRPGYDPPED